MAVLRRTRRNRGRRCRDGPPEDKPFHWIPCLLGAGVAAARRLSVHARPDLFNGIVQARGGFAIAVFALRLLPVLAVDTATVHRGTRWHTCGGRPSALHQERWLLVVPVVFVAAMASRTSSRSDAGHAVSTRFGAEGRSNPGRCARPRRESPREIGATCSGAGQQLALADRPHRADAGVLVDRDPSFVPFPPNEARAELADGYASGPVAVEVCSQPIVIGC